MYNEKLDLVMYNEKQQMQHCRNSSKIVQWGKIYTI